ncbi:dienelactone hydrolase family protein [Nocardia sp. NEAU-G5]|uniref:Dienelactone hydrolase family protein n=1 Tax=Nocardia albiluteola TaxID=2842303 RepID=A0ABS6ASK2_9NOCA|nr:dienelactone hydrolase family protein [Nocardia albiluteola]MBU3061011.1 dienelactone hydrolase family protein [Nocardia albiluteola]
MTTATFRQNTTFPTPNGQGHGYLAVPESGRGPGVLVIQEWWGLTDQIAGVVDRLAAEGFVTLAPDLFGGRVTHNAADGAKWMRELPIERGVAQLSSAVDYLLSHDTVTSEALGAVGFCMGGGFVVALAAAVGDKIAAAVPYYGANTGDNADFSSLRAAIQGHFGAYDTAVTPEHARHMVTSVRDHSDAAVELHFYPAGHAFANEENHSGNYDKTQADLAWERTLEFLRESLH